MPPPLLDALAAEAARDADILVIEGVMGLFDGVPGLPGRSGATADLAARFGLPVLLVLDVAGAGADRGGGGARLSRSRPCGPHRGRRAQPRRQRAAPDAGGRCHRRVGRAGASERCRATRRSTLPERHLGLVQAGEHADLAARLDRLADLAERHLDLDAVIAGAARSTLPTAASASPLPPPPGQRIALASDAAFSFVYPHILAGWRRAGAEIVPFSPLADEPPPQSCDSCWLPGGYPELHAGALAAAQRFRAGLAQFASTRPVHGECGGYMVLGEGLEDADGVRHAMTGLLGHATSFAKRKLHLGYREARLRVDSPIGAAGSTWRGHEFHYATLDRQRKRRAVGRSRRRPRTSARDMPAAGAATSPARSFTPSRRQTSRDSAHDLSDTPASAKVAIPR